MTSISKILVKSLIVLFFTSVLSSCSNTTYLANNSDLSAEGSGELSESEMDNVQLENAEPQKCLAEEMTALDQAGLWDEKFSANNITPSDNITYDFPVTMNSKVNMYLNLFQNQQREQFGRWLAKSTRYQPMVEKELEEAGLPKDLLYLAMIESGYNQLACSSSKAVGLWQFMQATGKQYDLKVDKYVDERRDPLKSTRAAVTYLSDLYKEFNDWHLAVAAYNGGPGTIRSGLAKFNVDNFWDLAGKKYLSLETKLYVPKLIAALIIAKDPEKYGFTEIAYSKPLRYGTITVGPGMSFEAIALISNSTTEEIQRFNQELRLGKTPLNRPQYKVKIPKESVEIAKSNLSRLHSIVSTGYKTHKVKRGETLSSISKKYRINKTTIQKVNDLHSGTLASGSKLRIPYSTITYQLVPEGSTGAAAAYKDSLVLHRIKKGDTISKIARQYHVPPAMIVTWNGLENTNSIRAGQQLALYIDNGGIKNEKTAVNTDSSKKNIKIIASGGYKNKLQQSETDSPYQLYNVKHGDSLWTISRKFSASTSEIKKWNSLTSDLIQPGSVLKLKKV